MGAAKFAVFFLVAVSSCCTEEGQASAGVKCDEGAPSWLGHETQGWRNIRSTLTELGMADAPSCIKGVPRLLKISSAPRVPRPEVLCSLFANVLKSLQNASMACDQVSSESTSTMGSGSLSDNTPILDLRIMLSLKKRVERCCRLVHSSRIGYSKQDPGATRMRNGQQPEAAASLSCFLQSGAVEAIKILQSLKMDVTSTGDPLQIDPTKQCLSAYLSAGAVQLNLAHIERILALIASFQSLTPLKAFQDSAERLSTALSSLSPTNSSFSLGQAPEVVFLVCTSFFPVCKQGRFLPPCTPLCDEVTQLTRVLGKFVSTSSVPALSFLSQATDICRRTRQQAFPCSLLRKGEIVPVQNKKELHQFEKTSLTGGVCLNLECKSPLIKTTESAHWERTLQKEVMSIHEMLSKAFPDSSLPFDGGVLPCGRECTTIGFSEGEQRASRILFSVASSCCVAVFLFSLVVMFYNRRVLAPLFLWRSMFIFTVVSTIAMCPFIPADVKGLDYLCNADGTLSTHQPGSNPSCGFVGWLVHFFALVAVGYLVILSFAWQEVIVSIDKPGFQKRAFSPMSGFWNTYRVDIISFILAVCPALALSATVSAQKGFDGLPLYGICSPSLERDFLVNYYTYYYVAALVPAAIFLAHGVICLVKKHGAIGAWQWLQKTDKKASSGKRSLKQRQSTLARCRANQRHLESFSRQTLVYLLCMTLSFGLSVYHGVYVRIYQSTWADQTLQHIRCKLLNCESETCPSLPTLKLGPLLVPVLLNIAAVFTVCTWALSKPFLKRVPFLRVALQHFRKRRWRTSYQQAEDKSLSSQNPSSTTTTKFMDRDCVD